MFEPFIGPLKAGPLLGEQGDDDAFIWAQATNEEPLTLTVISPGTPVSISRSWTVTPRADEFFCVVFHATGLDAPGPYEYEISNKISKTPRFKLRRMPRKNSKRLRIVYGSCIRKPDEAETMLRKMAGEGADLVMLVGDNSYFDQHGDEHDADNEQSMMAVHLRWRKAGGMRELCGSTSTLAIWDDHDFGRDNQGGDSSTKFEALRCFKRMWAQRRYGISGTHGIFSSVRCGPAQLFLLDVRYFRKPDSIIHSEQMQWLKDSLLASDAPVKLIVSGSQFLPNAAADLGWECWKLNGKDQQKKLLAFLAEHAIRGVVLISGDVHLGQLMFTRGNELSKGRRGGDVWELTSSPLTEETEMTENGRAIMHGPTQVYDPFMIQEVLVPNYGVIDINLERERKEISLELKSVDKSLFRVDVDLERLHISPRRPPKIKAFATGAGQSRALFFRGDQFVEYDIAARKVISAPASIKTRWPELKADFDTGTHWPPGRTFFFKGNGYKHSGVNSTDLSEWKYISDFFHWPIEFQTGIDAVLLWSDGHAYAFKGKDYIKFNVETRITVANFPQPIAKWWHGVDWEEGIDAVFHGPNGKLYFFRGDEYIEYDIHADSGGSPKPIASDWPGLSF